jgi:hypothetical protein
MILAHFIKTSINITFPVCNSDKYANSLILPLANQQELG